MISEVLKENENAMTLNLKGSYHFQRMYNLHISHSYIQTYLCV